MPQYDNLTDPTSKRLSPTTLRQAPQRGRTGALICEQEALYLRHLCETQGDIMASLHAAGYHPKDAANARNLDFQIRERINASSDARSVLIAAGLDLIEWAITIYWLKSQPEAKYRAVAAKLWGIPLGIYGQEHGAQGATINVSLLQQQEGHGTQAGLVNVSIDARKPLPAPQEPSSEPNP